MEKMNNGQDQMDNFSREREAVRKNDMEILEMKNTDIEIKSTFDGLITWWHSWTQQRKEDKSVETTQTKTKRENRKKEQGYILKISGML